MVILNEHKDRITEKKLIGPPDLAVEIASPSTAGYDRREKQDTYAQAGVAEYWIADPIGKNVEVLILENGTYRSSGVFQAQATLPSKVLKGFLVKVAQFFG